MLGEEQFAQLCQFTRDYLQRSAASSQLDWVREFPRAAEHRWHHTLNVLRNAERIVAGEGIGDQEAAIVRAAAVMHDLSVLECDHAIHGVESARIAERHLKEQGFAPDLVAGVAGAIAEHGVDFDTLTPEEMGAQFSLAGKILIEADILDKLGASAVTDALLILGKLARLSFECRSELLGGRAMERARYFKEYVWTETGRRIAAERFGFFKSYLAQLADEVVEAPEVA